MVRPSQSKLDLIRKGVVIPATPLALNAKRQFERNRQAALMRYYVDAGAGGVAVGMHFTQFEIRDPKFNLFEPVLATCAEVLDAYSAEQNKTIVKIAGINGSLPEALSQAETATRLGYDFAIVSMAALKEAALPDLIGHMREIGKIMPLFGFYLLTGVGGIHLPYDFWREVVEMEQVYGIKIAPFNRYFTLDVCRALADSGRAQEVTLYTGNDDSIVYDLITPFTFQVKGQPRTIRIRGGLLGQWACWTRTAVELLNQLQQIVDEHRPIPPDLLTLSAQLTDANAALFDAAQDYRGSISGIHEVLRRQGLLEGIWTLKPDEKLSPGQLPEIDRVLAAYPHLQDDAFVAENLERWLDA